MSRVGKTGVLRQWAYFTDIGCVPHRQVVNYRTLVFAIPVVRALSPHGEFTHSMPKKAVTHPTWSKTETAQCEVTRTSISKRNLYLPGTDLFLCLAPRRNLHSIRSRPADVCRSLLELKRRAHVDRIKIMSPTNIDTALKLQQILNGE